MPSKFEQDFTEEAPNFYEEFGIHGCKYTSPSGVVTTGLTLRILRNPAHQVARDSKTLGQLQSGQVIVEQSALAKPMIGGRFTAESVEIWTIETTPVLKNGQFYCTCSRTGAEVRAGRKAGE